MARSILDIIHWCPREEDLQGPITAYSITTTSSRRDCDEFEPPIRCLVIRWKERRMTKERLIAVRRCVPIICSPISFSRCTHVYIYIATPLVVCIIRVQKEPPRARVSLSDCAQSDSLALWWEHVIKRAIPNNSSAPYRWIIIQRYIALLLFFYHSVQVLL